MHICVCVCVHICSMLVCMCALTTYVGCVKKPEEGLSVKQDMKTESGSSQWELEGWDKRG